MGIFVSDQRWSLCYTLSDGKYNTNTVYVHTSKTSQVLSFTVPCTVARTRHPTRSHSSADSPMNNIGVKSSSHHLRQKVYSDVWAHATSCEGAVQRLISPLGGGDFFLHYIYMNIHIYILWIMFMSGERWSSCCTLSDGKRDKYKNESFLFATCWGTMYGVFFAMA